MSNYKFKKGDKVKVIAEGEPRVGQIGIVQENDNYYPDVLFYDGYIDYFHESNLLKQPQQFTRIEAAHFLLDNPDKVLKYNGINITVFINGDKEMVTSKHQAFQPLLKDGQLFELAPKKKLKQMPFAEAYVLAREKQVCLTDSIGTEYYNNLSKCLSGLENKIILGNWTVKGVYEEATQ